MVVAIKIITALLSQGLLFALGLTSCIAAERQPNPYRFPAAKGTPVPIIEGYWASPPEACSELEVSDRSRPHVGQKGHPITTRSANETATYAYLSPWLANWPDGICFVLSIRKAKDGLFVLKGVCGDTDRFSGTVDVLSKTEIVLSRVDEYERRSDRYGLCLAIR